MSSTGDVHVQLDPSQPALVAGYPAVGVGAPIAAAPGAGIPYNPDTFAPTVTSNYPSVVEGASSSSSPRHGSEEKKKKLPDPANSLADNKAAGKFGVKADEANAKINKNAHVKKAGDWLSPGFQEPFFGCLSSAAGCGLSCLCPCTLCAANEANVTGRPATYVDFCLCPNPYTTRQTIRTKYNMGFSPYRDAIATLCCSCCLNHQNTREIARRSGSPPEYFKMVP